MQEVTPVGKPAPVVPLAGRDGNAFSIVGRVARALPRTGHTKDDIKTFQNDAFSGDYTHVLQTAMAWSVEPDYDDDEDES